MTIDPRDPERPTPADFYDEMAAHYISAVDSKAHNALYERPATLALLPPLSGLRILDAGCGSGWYANYFLEQGAASVTCIDASPKMVAAARERLGVQAVVQVHDLSKPLDFAGDASFDLIVSPLVLHYLPDLKPVFLELWRVLRPHGWLVFSVHHPTLVFNAHHLADYYQTIWIEEEWDAGKVGFYHHPLEVYTGGLASAGFVIERLHEARPTVEFQARDPENYEKIMHNPWFLFFRARRDN